jgi:alpha-L-fucosidase
MRTVIGVLSALLLLAASLCGQTDEARLRWWRDARFGMFIHWGLYAIPAGEWSGRQIHGLGECIMANATISRDQYAALARRFNPVQFNADEWVRIAKDAGMKYIVITSKHHDGFAMFGSKVSPFNVVDATPFRRDPIRELALACRKAGLRLSFYYSHVLDWHEPNAPGINEYLHSEGENVPEDFGRDFARYYSEKAEPQVRELLTNYGPIGLIWFDWWRDKPLTPEQAREMATLVHRLQPDCLVNGRIGYGFGDYASSGDNELRHSARRDWEAPATINKTWGYRRDDNNWKSATELVRNLVRVVSQNGNYLLNVGPTAEGVIPAPSVERLREVGKWMRVNEESIRGAGPAPFPKPFEWGVATARADKIYLHLFDWPKGRLAVDGVPGRVRSASLLAGRAPLRFQQPAGSRLTIELPDEPPDPHDSVIVLEMAQ